MEDKLHCNINGLYEEGEARGDVWWPDLQSVNGIMPPWTWQLDHGGAIDHQPAVVIDPIPDLLQSYPSLPFFPLQLHHLFQDDFFNKYDEEVALFCESLKVDQKEVITDNNVKEDGISDASPMLDHVGKSETEIMIKREFMNKRNCNYGHIKKEEEEEESSHDREMRVDKMTISFEEVSRCFYMPIRQAAKELNIGLTLLKKKCRQLGIPRWPQRKMKSLQTLIDNVQLLGRPEEGEAGAAQLRSAVEILEEERKMMEKEPTMQLEEKTKRLRQACFKANYKRRRLVLLSDPPPPPLQSLQSRSAGYH